MSKKRSRRTRRPPADRTATTDIVTQLEIAIRNPHAAAIGALIGRLVPWFGRTLAHGEIQAAWTSNRLLALAMVAVVMGCGVFSGLSVYKFGLSAFGDARKALGFVLALEGVMLVSHGVTSAVALAVLILINAVANGSVIALARDAACRRRDADARRVASRRKTAPAPAARSTQPLQAPGVFEAPSPRTNDTSLVRWIPTSRHLDVPSCDVRRPRGTADHAKTHVARPGERDKTMKEMLWRSIFRSSLTCISSSTPTAVRPSRGKYLSLGTSSSSQAI